MRNATTGRHGMDTEPPNWEEIYARGPRWDIGRPQPAFLALADLRGLRAVVPPGGRYYVLCFRGPQGGSGPRRLVREDVTACFTEGWRVDATEETTLDSLTDEDGIPAWLIALTRI